MPTTNTEKLLKSGNFKQTPVINNMSKFAPATVSTDFPKIQTGIAKNIEKRKKEERKENGVGFLSGGLISDFFDVISAGQFAGTGFIEQKLEEGGHLKNTGASAKKGLEKRASNINLIKRIGEETGKGGLLTGQYVPTQSVWGNFVRELPSVAIGLLGDVILDPTNLIPTKLVTKPATTAKNLITKTPAVARSIEAIEKNNAFQATQRFFAPRGGQSPEFRQLDRKRIINESLAGERNVKLISPIIESPNAMQQRLNQILRGGITTDDELRRIAQPVRQEIDDAGEVISDLSPDLLKPEVFEQNKGKYITNLYKSKIEDKESGELLNTLFLRSGGVRVPGEQFKRRIFFGDKILDGGFTRDGKYESKFDDFFNLSPEDKKVVIQKAQDTDMPPISGGLNRIANKLQTAVEKNKNVLDFKDFTTQASAKNLSDLLTSKVRQSLGEIKEAGLPAAKTLDNVTKAKIRLKFFKDLMESGAIKRVRNDTTGHSFQLPESDLLGEASGGWMNRADVESIQDRFFKIPTELDKTYGKLLRTWKTFKTAYNPATISRNDLTNFFILNPLGGVPVWRLDVYNRALKGIGKQSDSLWQEFRSVGGGLSSQASAELIDRATEIYKSNTDTAKGIKKIFPKIQDFHKKVVDFYGSQDTFFKFANFIKGKEDGLDAISAIQRANMYLVDYTEMPRFVEWARKSPFGAPFIAFTYGVSIPFAKTLLQNPAKLSRYYKMLRAIEAINPYGETEEDRNNIEAALPERLKGMKALRMPYKDANGNEVFIDLRYILPFNILEMGDEDGALTKLGVPKSLQPSNPVATIIGDLIRNKSSFNGRPVVPPASTRFEAYMAIGDYIQKQLIPSWSLGVPTMIEGKMRFGGYTIEKIIDAAMKQPTYPAEEPRDFTSTLFDTVFGIKNIPVDIQQEIRWRKLEEVNKIKEITSQILRIKNRKTLTETQKDREIEKLKNKLEELRK